MSGTLLVVSGPSGVGKSTVCSRLRTEFPQIALSVSYTTRAPRGGESDGVDYHFVSRARFDAMIEDGAFVEWAEVHGNRYGTSFQAVGSELEQGHSVLFDIDYQGAASLRAVYTKAAVTVMLLPPSMAELERRLRGRATDDENVIRERLENALGEIAQTPNFDYLVINENIDDTYDSLRAIFVASLSSVYGRKKELETRFGVRVLD